MEATFCFLDLAGYSALTEAHGDDAAANLAGRFAAMVNDALGGEGRLVKTIGDAVLFTTPQPAAAVQVVQRIFRHSSGEPDFPVLRGGLHHGAAVERGSDVFGTAVNIAARVASHAGGDQVLATEVVARAARSLAIEVLGIGTVALRNIREPLALFQLAVATGPAAMVIDPVCRMRIAPDRAQGRIAFAGIDYWFCSMECLSTFAAAPARHAPDDRRQK